MKLKDNGLLNVSQDDKDQEKPDIPPKKEKSALRISYESNFKISISKEAYLLKSIHTIRTNSSESTEKSLKHRVTCLYISDDEKKLYTGSMNGEILFWYPLSDFSEFYSDSLSGVSSTSKKCKICNNLFALLDKKLSCTLCRATVCSNCSKNEVV
jgi:hypothetical protein